MPRQSGISPEAYQMQVATRHIEEALKALRAAWRYKRSSPASRHIEAAAQELKRAQASLVAAEQGSGYEVKTH